MALTKKPVIVCESAPSSSLGRRMDAAALADLIGGRWPKVIGFSWWNAAFYNDPEDASRQSDMRIQNSRGWRRCSGRWWGRAEGAERGAGVGPRQASRGVGTRHAESVRHGGRSDPLAANQVVEGLAVTDGAPVAAFHQNLRRADARVVVGSRDDRTRQP